MEPLITQKPAVCYVLVREDLPIEIQMVQACHAVQEVVRCHNLLHYDPVSPIDERTVIRLLHVKDEGELLSFHRRLCMMSYDVKLIFEPDPPWCGKAMALATEPATKRISALGKIFFHLQRAQFGMTDAGDVG